MEETNFDPYYPKPHFFSLYPDLVTTGEANWKLPLQNELSLWAHCSVGKEEKTNMTTNERKLQ